MRTMTSRLNITIKDSVIRRIKKYAHRNNTSVSKIIQQQLEQVLDSENNDPSFGIFVKKFTGSIQKNKAIDIKEEQKQHIKDKYAL